MRGSLSESISGTAFTETDYHNEEATEFGLMRKDGGLAPAKKPNREEIKHHLAGHPSLKYSSEATLTHWLTVYTREVL